MKKLKNEVFYTIFIILTISLIFIISFFFYQNYKEEKRKVESSLRSANDIMPPKPNDSDRTIFMGEDIYTVNINSNNEITNIVSHSIKENKDIKEIANKILSSSNKKSLNIGFLLTNKYSYSYKEGNKLIIVDNTSTQKRLRSSLITLLLVFVFLEMIFILISLLLSKKIVKPVKETFLKQKRFIADASHELKTPLSIIVASADALTSEPNEKKWLDNIKNESERMNQLIVKLLDLASTERIKKEEFVMSDLSKIVLLTSLSFEGIAYEKKVKLNFDIEDNINMKLDVNDIKQLVEILLDNAIKHSIKDSEVMVSLKRETNNIVFIVKNKGEAIPKGDEEKIFERFYRVDESRNRNENRYGLGLAIAKNIVTSHDGKINAFSENGYTTFKIIFKN